MDAVELAVAQFTQGASAMGAWVLVSQEHELGGQHDRAITAALRQLDPQIAPLWVTSYWRTPNGHEITKRHLMTRYVPDPRVRMKAESYKRTGIRNVKMPAVIPPELQGLPSCGPYFEAELLEGKSDGLKPGPYEPMTWELVRRIEIATHALRNHRIEELDAKRIAKARAAEDRADRLFWERQHLRAAAEREWRLKQRGELVRVPSATGEKVSLSSNLIRLRKIAAEGAEA